MGGKYNALFSLRLFIVVASSETRVFYGRRGCIEALVHYDVFNRYVYFMTLCCGSMLSYLSDYVKIMVTFVL